MAIFTSAKVAWATGTGVDETAEQTLAVPGAARELIGVRGHVHTTQGNPAESIIGVFKIKGNNWTHNPYEWFSEIGSSKLGAIDEVGYAIEPRWWPAYLPVMPGVDYAVTYEALDALAVDGQAAIDLKWSTAPTGREPILRLCSRETASSTATGPGLTLPDAGRIVEFTFAYGASTVAGDDPSIARLFITSSNLEEIQTLSLTQNIHALEATTGVALGTLMHADIDIPVKAGAASAVFTSSITVDVALGTAGAYAYSIGYIPRSVSR